MCTAKEGNWLTAGIYAGKANNLIGRLEKPGIQEEIRGGRPGATVPEYRDRTLGQIRNSMRCVYPCRHAGLGTREVRIHRLQNDMLFSQIPYKTIFVYDVRACQKF